jgi:hypothetical protein
VEALIGEVAAIRGVTLSRPIPVELLDEPRFAAAVDEFFVANESSAGAGFEDATSLAAQAVRRTAQRAMLQEQIIGFYDEDSRKVFLRKRPAGPPRSVGDVVPEERRGAAAALP